MPAPSRSELFKPAAISLLFLAGTIAGLDLPHPTKSGADADFVPFVMEKNGICAIPWGAGNYRWPEQLFWESMSQIGKEGHVMRSLGDGMDKDGQTPVMSSVAWGYEYKAAIGGDSAAKLGDMRLVDGWKQYGEWITARQHYLALDWEGKIFYPYAGYITPMMPLDKADWPEGIDSATFGDWAGLKLGRLANEIHSRGFMAADFVVGLYGGNHDFHPRVIDAFERWAGVKVPGTTVKERADVIKAKHWSRYNDYKSELFARFYARAAETIRSAGREPLVGGQILPHAASVRGTGNDFRIYLKHLPARNWYFFVELQSDGGRPVADYWERSTQMGGHAARAPEFPLGAIMDADMNSFWDAVKGAKKDGDWGRAYLKHVWLSVGWTHVAKSDGSVRRAPMGMQRSYWDLGGVDTPIVALMRNHIPRHPFGPAFYYSTDLERQSENTGNPNFYYWFEPNAEAWMLRGAPVGYYVSDTALAKLKPENRPSGWFVYVDNLGKTKLSAVERAKLEAIAPILDIKDFANSCPVSFSGDSLGGYGFIDQNGSVIVLSSNRSEKDVEGAIRFTKVEDGYYRVHDLLTGDTARMVVTDNKGHFPMTWKARDTRVLEIPGLREKGRRLPSDGYPGGYLRFLPGILRTDGKRIDAIGRHFSTGPQFIWSVEDR
ncbi:MAG: hypothetical protein IPK50_13445 [Fibrobacterota bacterium]|nr:hypothetical protein [Fibrobacterota bacterium]QQS03311.1 MAG: hypothetical protein IPK50_13445 [Fibrobacterota bacterium]